MEESANPAMPMRGGRVLQNLGVSTYHVLQQVQHLVQISTIRHPDGQIELPDRAEVVQDFTDDLAIGDDNAGMVRMREGCGEEVDFGDVAVDTEKGDMFADSVWFGEDDREACHDIAQHPLQGEANAEPCDAESCNEGRNLQAELVQGDEQPHDDHQGLDDASQQQAKWGLKVLLTQPALAEPSDGPGRKQRDHQDQRRSNDAEAVLHDILGDQVRQRHIFPGCCQRPSNPLSKSFPCCFRSSGFAEPFSNSPMAPVTFSLTCSFTFPANILVSRP